MRFAVGVEYDGTHYYGFQNQVYDQLPTIQEKLESAISQVANHKVSIIAAGRTDAGVHATNQVIHFDTESIRDERQWLLGINSNLPDDISVKWIKLVPDDFHARFSAVSRRYQYLILNSPVKSALMRNRAVLVYKNLDEKLMHQAAQNFIGEHDFSAFRAAECQAKSPIREVKYFSVTRYKNFIYCEVEANAFLHHMVRNMVGVLIEIGLGKKEITWAKEVLDKKDRKLAGVTAPACGLYLVNVTYLDFGFVAE